MRRAVQAFLFVVIIFSMLNIAYSIYVVFVKQSWLFTWHLDRRFPFSLIPLWGFCLVSIAACALGFYYYPRSHNLPKFGCDKVNVFFIYMAIGLVLWILVAINLVHSYYIGDFHIVGIIETILSGRAPLPFKELSLADVDVFPTLGDTIFIAYLFSFLFSYLTIWRGLKGATAHSDGIQVTTHCTV